MASHNVADVVPGPEFVLINDHAISSITLLPLGDMIVDINLSTCCQIGWKDRPDSHASLLMSVPSMMTSPPVLAKHRVSV